jgi:stearoyl-CoA desaturase (delta-9 desaturase)
MPSSQAVAGDLAIKPEFVDQKSPMASTSEPNRNPNYDPKKPHITDTPITKANWYKHVNWLNVRSVKQFALRRVIADMTNRSSLLSVSPSQAVSLPFGHL